MKNLFIFDSLLYFVCLSLIIKNIYNCETEKKKYLISCVTYIGILSVSCFLDNNVFISLYILFPILQVFALRIGFNNSKLSQILHAYIFIYCINAISILVISILVNAKFQHTMWIDSIVNSVSCMFCIIICLSKARTFIQQIIEWTPISVKRIISLLLIFDLCLITLVSNKIYNSNTKVWFDFIQNFVLLTVLLLLLIIGILVCVMLSNNRLKQLTTNYEQQILAQAEHYKLLAESNYEIRRFKHDFKNMSIAMETLLKDEGNPQALELLQQYNNALEFPNNSAHFYDTGNGIADALLADKQQKATSCNCNIVFEGAIPTSCLLPTDICVILGNTLDNAIEACEKIQAEDPLTITVSSQCNSGFMFLSITNPTSEKININNNYIATTKKNKTLHGFGLYSLNSVVKKYDGNIELKATENTFTANIDLPLLISTT